MSVTSGQRHKTPLLFASVSFFFQGGIYKEHDFDHELNSQIPEKNAAKLPVRLCGKWAESVEGKPELST